MRKGRVPAGLALCLALAWVAAGSPALQAGAQNITINDNDDAPLERCDQLDISFDRRPAVRDEEQFQVRAQDALRVSLFEHGGVALSEGPGDQHVITLCKAAPRSARDGIAGIRPRVNGTDVSVSGPDGPWVGYLIVRSPRGSRVEITVTNGPVRAEEFDGRLAVKTINGAITFDSVRGHVSARAENGPIKLRGGDGTVSLETQNGPLAVRLTGERWLSGALEARGHNGPLSVSVPADYRSGVEIESSDHVPWSCRGTRGCPEGGIRSGSRHARLGSGSTQVRLSTVNGPVSVNVSSN